MSKTTSAEVKSKRDRSGASKSGKTFNWTEYSRNYSERTVNKRNAKDVECVATAEAFLWHAVTADPVEYTCSVKVAELQKTRILWDCLWSRRIIGQPALKSVEPNTDFVQRTESVFRSLVKQKSFLYCVPLLKCRVTEWAPCDHKSFSIFVVQAFEHIRICVRLCRYKRHDELGLNFSFRLAQRGHHENYAVFWNVTHIIRIIKIKVKCVASVE